MIGPTRRTAGGWRLVAAIFVIVSALPVAFGSARAQSVATGSITCVDANSLLDEETVTISDGLNPAQTFEFDRSGDGVAPGHVLVYVSDEIDSSEVAIRLTSAISSQTGPEFSLDAVVDQANVIQLTNQVPGHAGNVPITETVVDPEFIVQGMSGGDVDECALGIDNCDALASCENDPIGSFHCQCPQGFVGDGVICTDVDECALPDPVCSPQSTCTNLPGRYHCSPCGRGFFGTGVTCTDVDECSLPEPVCSPHSTCTNQPGFFLCSPCEPGFVGDGIGPNGCLPLEGPTVPGLGRFALLALCAAIFALGSWQMRRNVV